MRFIFRLRGQVSFSKVRSDTDTISLKDGQKNLWLNLFFKSADSGVIKDLHNDPPIKIHNTRQKDGLSVPSIKTKSYFNSFWPRSAREQICKKRYTININDKLKKILEFLQPLLLYKGLFVGKTQSDLKGN